MLDRIDRQILELLQKDAESSVSEIAEKVALSGSACSRRISRLREEGYFTGAIALLDRNKFNLPTTMFVIVRTNCHSAGWLELFHRAVATVPEIVEVHRLTGNFDYILKILLPNIEYYDSIYKQLVSQVELYDMSAYISMETVKLATGIPTSHL
jgi:Lrp/AsnC family transcriptional regulator